MLLLAWWFTEGYTHWLGWLWIVLSGAACYAVALHELARTNLCATGNGVEIRSGLPWAPRHHVLRAGELRIIWVLEQVRSEQSAINYDWNRRAAYQLALEHADGRRFPVFREFDEKEHAAAAAERLTGLLGSPVQWEPRPKPMRLRTGIGIVAAFGLLFFLIARSC